MKAFWLSSAFMPRAALRAYISGMLKGSCKAASLRQLVESRGAYLMKLSFVAKDMVSLFNLWRSPEPIPKATVYSTKAFSDAYPVSHRHA